VIDAALLDRVPLLRGVGLRARHELAVRAVERRFAPGETLFTAGTPSRGIHVILDGRVRVLRGAGRQHVVHTEGPGGTLGEVPLFEGGGYPATAVAAEPVRCIVLSEPAIRAAVAADPEVAWVFLRRLAARVRALVDRLDTLTGRSVAARLAGLLLDRSAAAGGAPFTLGETQAAVAEELGTVREVLVRQLRGLRGAGVLSSSRRGWYAVVDENALRRAAAEGGGA
jgi:CRP/FNR family transcriptional regulator